MPTSAGAAATGQASPGAPETGPPPRDLRAGRLRNRLLLTYLLPTGLLLLAAGLLAYTGARRGAVEELGQRLTAIAQATSGILSSGADAERISRLTPDMGRVHQNLRNKLEQFREATDVRRIFILGPQLQAKVDTRDGTPIGATLPEVLQDRREIALALQGEATASILFTGEDGVRYLTGYAPIRLPDTDEVVGLVGVEGSSSSFRSLDRLALTYGTAGAVLLLLLFTISLVVSQRISEPIRELAQAARRIGDGDLDTEVRPLGDDEIALLAGSLNEMRRAIQHREQDLQLMLSGIAHEVRNPLGGMELFSGLLAEEVASQPEAAGYAARIRKELDHLKRVVNEFLDFARRTPLQQSLLLVDTLLQDVVATTRSDPVACGCRFEMISGPAGLQLEADGRRLRQLLLNLLRNSCQAMPQGGTVRLTVAEQDDELHLGVEDEGPGIPDELAEQVFRPFFTTKEQGTGLGLALCRKSAGEHGGRLLLGRGPEGRGARITVVLPRRRRLPRLAGPLPPPEHDRLPQGEGLIGSDEPLIGGDEAMVFGDEPLIGENPSKNNSNPCISERMNS